MAKGARSMVKGAKSMVKGARRLEMVKLSDRSSESELKLHFGRLLPLIRAPFTIDFRRKAINPKGLNPFGRMLLAPFTTAEKPC